MNWWLNAARTILKISRNDDDSKWPVTISPGREGRGELIRTLLGSRLESLVRSRRESKLRLRTLHWTQSTSKRDWRPSEELVISDATVLVCLRRIGFCFSRADKQVFPPWCWVTKLDLSKFRRISKITTLQHQRQTFRGIQPTTKTMTPSSKNSKQSKLCFKKCQKKPQTDSSWAVNIGEVQPGRNNDDDQKSDIRLAWKFPKADTLHVGCIESWPDGAKHGKSLSRGSGKRDATGVSTLWTDRPLFVRVFAAIIVGRRLNGWWVDIILVESRGFVSVTGRNWVLNIYREDSRKWITLLVDWAKATK